MSIPILFSLHGFLLMDGKPTIHHLSLRLILMVLTFNLSVFPHTPCHGAERMRCDDQLARVDCVCKHVKSWASCIWVAFPVCSCSTFTSLLFTSPCFPPTEKCRKKVKHETCFVGDKAVKNAELLDHIQKWERLAKCQYDKSNLYNQPLLRASSCLRINDHIYQIVLE